jgi:hypothetical protein
MAIDVVRRIASLLQVLRIETGAGDAGVLLDDLLLDWLALPDL